MKVFADFLFALIDTSQNLLNFLLFFRKIVVRPLLYLFYDRIEEKREDHDPFLRFFILKDFFFA